MQRREFLAGAMAAPLAQDQLEEAARRIQAAVASTDERTRVAAAVLHVEQRGSRFTRAFGAARDPGAVFLLASITKPMTVTGVMILADRGALRLTDPVQRFIPEFAGGDRNLVTVRHLLTHTSGLPDMLPENIDLRKRHAPLADFVAGACRTPLLFKPGTELRYQSMGTLLASEVIRRVAKEPVRRFLKRELFEPLGMKHTVLGLDGLKIPATAQCQVEESSDWDWNSPYWRDLGAPWGGAHSTAGDVATLLRYFLEPDRRLMKPETARSMIVNQSGLDKPWGLGWMIDSGRFGKKCSGSTFGHYGSTGTVGWADPVTRTICVLLTTKPAAQSRDGLLGPVSDRVSEAAYDAPRER